MGRPLKYDFNPGDIFGKWVVLEKVMVPCNGGNSQTTAYRCRCECGTESVINGYHLAHGNSRMCRECAYSGMKGHNPWVNGTHCASYIDGRSTHELYDTWDGMLKRCYNPKSISYKNYGARGICVCDEWRSDFFAFEHWCFENGYRKELQLDRIDSSKGYTPDNCRWVTPKENVLNRACTRWITYDGETRTICDWAKSIGISETGLNDRLKKGWPLEKALTLPPHKGLRLEKRL